MNKKPECATCPHLIKKHGWTICTFKGKAGCKWDDVILDSFAEEVEGGGGSA